MSSRRREQPYYRVCAYVIFAGLLAAVLGPSGLASWIFPIYLTVGVIETIATTVVAVRRRRENPPPKHARRRLGPPMEWIDR